MASPFSWARSLSAAFRVDLSVLKRDAKRLHRACPDVFGQSYPLSRCQEAVAKMRGAKDWHQAVQSASKAAKKTAPWFEPGHNDFYESVLEALTTAEVETDEGSGCFFTGDLNDSVTPALALWSQEMIWRKVPGLALIDAHADTVQETALWPAAEALGLTAMLQSCRVLDMRLARCPVALSATSRDWVNSLTFALAGEHRKALEDSGVNTTLESIINGLASEQGDPLGDDGRKALVSYHLVEKAIGFILYGGGELPPGLEDNEEQSSIRHRVQKYLIPARRNPDLATAFAALNGLVVQLRNKEFRLGTILSQESQWRPTIVMFSIDDAASCALASVVHSLYYWRYVGWELRHTGIEPRPVLYINDNGSAELAPWLLESSCARSMVATGAAHRSDSHRGFAIACSPYAVASSGKKVSYVEGQTAAFSNSPAIEPTLTS